MQKQGLKVIAVMALLASFECTWAQGLPMQGPNADLGQTNDPSNGTYGVGGAQYGMSPDASLPDPSAASAPFPRKLDVRSPYAEQLDNGDGTGLTLSRQLGSGYLLDANGNPLLERGPGPNPAQNSYQGQLQSRSRPVLEETNEFQRLIQQTTGLLLPRFGAEYFASREMNPSQMVPAPADYTLGPGDEVLVRASGSIDIDFKGSIDRNGQFNLPKIGTLNLAGVKSEQVENTIRQAVARLYKGFTLNVTLGRLRTLNIYVVGQVRKPGSYRVSSLSTVLSALTETGGPNAQGSVRAVQLKRQGATIAEIDLYAFLAKGDNSADHKLQDGDVLFVPPAQGFVALTGEVERPAVFELKGNGETLGDLLKVAGGSPVGADPRRVMIERIDAAANQPLRIEQVALDSKGLTFPLQRGDRISVQAIHPEFANAVTLRGNVSQAVRAAFRPGMRVSDLIPNKEALLSKAVVRRYNRLTLNQEQRERQRQVNDDRQERVNNGVTTTAVLTPPLPIPSLLERLGADEDGINWDYALIERVDPQDLRVNLLSFNLAEALANPAGNQNLPLQAGDILTVFANDDLRVPVARRKVLVRIEGEVIHPGVYQFTQGERLQQVIERAGGLTKDAYLFGAEFYRESARKSQQENLDKLVSRLEKDAASANGKLSANVSTDPTLAAAAQLRLTAQAEANKQALAKLREVKAAGRISLETRPEDLALVALPDLRVEAGDHLVLPPKPDFIQVFGSVRTEAALLFKPHRTVGDYLRQAGVTPDADEAAVFVVRANGTIASDGDGWYETLRGLTVAPGDIIVVPEKLDKESAYTVAVRNAKDITQVLGNLLIGAASIKVLRQ